MADDAEKETKSSSGGGILPIINMVLLILVLAVGGFVAWKMMQMEQSGVATDKAPTETAETKIPEVDEESDKPPVLMAVDNITINLADADVSRFLRAKIKLELRSEEALAKLDTDAGKAKINDLILTILSSKTFEDIRTPRGKYALKEELIFRLNKIFSGKPVKKLYFTDFVSQ